jgi:hypothetical protein
MNMRIFVEALSLSEINELSNVISDVRRERIAPSLNPLTKYQKELIQRGKYIQAIKEYRTRFNCGLLEAKIACDSYRDIMKG